MTAAGRAVVTGASGFVGGHVLEALVGAGVAARGVARATSDTRWFPPEVEHCTASLEDAGALGAAVRDSGVIFHLAAVTSSAREDDYARVNVEGTRRILEAVRAEAPRARVVLCSSLAAAGPARAGEPVREDDEPRPVSPYGRSKLAAERVADEFVREHGLDIVIVRPTAVYGPRDRDILTVFRLVRFGIAVRVAPAGQRLTMIHARDLARALLLAAERGGREPGRARRYHVSDGCTYSWRQVIDAIASALGRKRVHAIRVPRALADAEAMAQELASIVRRRKPLLTRGRIAELAASDWSCDITRARAELGFAPSISLREGVRETAAWYREERWL